MIRRRKPRFSLARRGTTRPRCASSPAIRRSATKSSDSTLNRRHSLEPLLNHRRAVGPGDQRLGAGSSVGGYRGRACVGRAIARIHAHGCHRQFLDGDPGVPFRVPIRPMGGATEGWIGGRKGSGGGSARLSSPSSARPDPASARFERLALSPAGEQRFSVCAADPSSAPASNAQSGSPDPRCASTSRRCPAYPHWSARSAR